MAVSTIDSADFILFDKWPGAPLRNVNDVLYSGFLTATHHNVAAPAHELGEKVQIRNHTDGLEGIATLIYLKYDGTSAPTCAAKQFVVQSSATEPFTVTNDPDMSGIINTGNPLAAVAVSAMTDQRYGWFWCGGVCPQYAIPALEGNFATDTNVVRGPIVVHDLDPTDAMGLGPLASTEQAIGFALAADAA